VFSTVFVLTIHLCTNSLTIYIKLSQFRVYHLAVELLHPLITVIFFKIIGKAVLYLQQLIYRRLPVRSFAKNQLSPGTISISHLTTPLRRILQHSPVRSFDNLDMVRSPDFGSNLSNYPFFFNKHNLVFKVKNLYYIDNNKL